jgi:hypothetical protein
MVAVDAVTIEVLSCNNASMRYIFKGEKPANLPAQVEREHQWPAETVLSEEHRLVGALASLSETTP